MGKYHLRKPTELLRDAPGLREHKLHRLRKTCATRWLQSGIDLMKIRTWLGHESLAVTQLYLDDAELTDSGIQAKVDRAGAGASN